MKQTMMGIFVPSTGLLRYDYDEGYIKKYSLSKSIEI